MAEITEGRGYWHRQFGRFHYGFYAMAVVFAVVLLFHRDLVSRYPWLVVLPLGSLVRALAFHHMTVADAGDHLSLRYGPMSVPWFRRRIPYGTIESVAPERSSIWDGWGVHFVPWPGRRGMMYNLWGRGCVKVVAGGKTVRIGTDDPSGLSAFLKTKMTN